MAKHVNRAIGRKLCQQGRTGEAAEQGKANGFVHCVFKGNGKSYQVSVQTRKPPLWRQGNEAEVRPSAVGN
jgi:hypothetical protein